MIIIHLVNYKNIIQTIHYIVSKFGTKLTNPQLNITGIIILWKFWILFLNNNLLIKST